MGASPMRKWYRFLLRNAFEIAKVVIQIIRFINKGRD